MKKWIRADRRLPEDSNDRLVTIKSRDGELFVTIGRYNGRDWKTRDTKYANGGNKVIAWKPLPEPYRAESEGRDEIQTTEKAALSR